MTDGVRIDELDPTALINVAHELAAIKDGLTVKLTLQQIRDLFQTYFDTRYTAAAGGANIGLIGFFPLNGAPTGWLKLNGALISRTTYSGLWAAAQTSGNLAASDGAWTSGQFSPGDGSTTFRVPDLRGEFLRAWADGKAVDTGRVLGSNQSEDFKSHGHGVNDPTHTHGPSTLLGQGSGSGLQTAGGTTVSYSVQVANAATGITIQNTGGAETRPRNIAWLACIKY